MPGTVQRRRALSLRRVAVLLAPFALLAVLVGCSTPSNDGSSGPGPTSSATTEPVPSSTLPPADVTATVADESYAFPVLLECALGTEAAPDDRKVVAETADGNARLTVVTFADPEFSGLSSITLELQDPVWIYSSSFTGEQDSGFTAVVRPDGGDGTAKVRASGSGAPTENVDAAWSFSC
jgi:hypothetical protein